MATTGADQPEKLSWTIFILTAVGAAAFVGAVLVYVM